MCRRLVSRYASWLLGAIILLCITTHVYAADIEIPLKPGATDQTVTISFQNPTIREVRDLKIRVENLPSWASNVKLSKESIKRLDIAESVDITLRFDINNKIDKNDIGDIELRFALEEGQGELDTYVLTIGPSTIEESAGIALSNTPLVLRLVKVSEPVLSEDSKKDDCRLTRSGGAGAVKTCGVAPFGGNAMSAGLTRFPTEIVLGQPFEVELSYKWASSRRNFKPCEEQEFKDDKGRASCFFLWAYFRSGRGKMIADTSISFLPDEDNSAKGTVRFIPEKCTARYPDNLPCNHPDIIAAMKKGKHDGRIYTYRIESPDPDQYGDTTEIFHSSNLPVNEEGFVIPMTKENQWYEGYKHQDKTNAELKDINSDDGYQLRMHFSSDELVTAYYMPIPVGGEYLKSASPYNYPGNISAPKALPEYLLVVMEIKGSGYNIYPGKKPKSVGGRRMEGWARSVLTVKWGEDPIEKAKERYKSWFSPVPSCIKKFSRGGGMPEVWDSGPQIRILNVGPYLNGFELKKDKAAGGFDIGGKWEYIDSDQKEWENWRCEE